MVVGVEMKRHADSSEIGITPTGSPTNGYRSRWLADHWLDMQNKNLTFGCKFAMEA
jgi:hypothetical protein